MPNIADRDRTDFDMAAEIRRRREIIWQGDDLDREKQPVTHTEAVCAILAVGYMSFYGHPLLPHEFLTNAADDLKVYDLSRTLKGPDDASEAFLEGREPHIAIMLKELLELAEDLHERGMSISEIAASAKAQVMSLAGQARTLGFKSVEKFIHGNLSKEIWDAVLRQSIVDAE